MNTKYIFALLLTASSLFVSAQQKKKSPKLPAEASVFIEANFKGIQIEEVKKETEGTTFIYQVKMASDAEIQFNNRGRWSSVESNTTTLPTTMLQPSVGIYITKTYPNAKITKIKKGARFNFVEIDNETTLQFDTEGNFYRIMEK